MFKKFGIFTLTLVMIMSLFVGCAKEAPEESLIETPVVEKEDNAEAPETPKRYPMVIEDTLGEEIVLEEKPQRVVSVAPSITESFFALGLEAFLVGRTDYCDYPEKAQEVTSVGTLREPNLEKIIELEADLVIASTHFEEDVHEKLQELGITVMVLNPNDSFEGVYEVLKKIGMAMEAEDAAEELVLSMKNHVQEVKEKVQHLETPSVYYVVGFGEYGDFTAGGDTFIHEMIEEAGGFNVAQDVEGWSYSLEKLIEKDPEVLIVSKYYDTKAQIIEAQGYKDLSAVKNQRVIEIDNNLIDRQGPRLAEGFEALARAIHQEAFE